MLAYKKKYFLLIESIKDIDLRNIKKHGKFIIIYRNFNISDNIKELFEFRKKCKLKSIGFYVANNLDLSLKLKADGVYLSSYNKSFKPLFFKKVHFNIIGSAHNDKEIIQKIKQGCEYIVLSKLFKVNYSKKSPYLGLIKFNNYSYKFKNKLIPLGGIKIKNLNKLKHVKCDGMVLLSEIKKKPAKIINRLF